MEENSLRHTKSPFPTIKSDVPVFDSLLVTNITRKRCVHVHCTKNKSFQNRNSLFLMELKYLVYIHKILIMITGVWKLKQRIFWRENEISKLCYSQRTIFVILLQILHTRKYKENNKPMFFFLSFTQNVNTINEECR